MSVMHEVPVIDTRHGPVRGRSAAGLSIFCGIPYAKPLQGLGWFRAPRAPEPWTEPLDATAFGVACPQESSGVLGVGATGAACLSLNIWAPSSAAAFSGSVSASALKPVMLWFHGGGFATGSSAQALYDGSQLAQVGDVVVVSVNYRLGMLGFGDLAMALGDERFHTNVGLRDQIAALHWVQDNIAAFGGDPANVTIFGESAGAMSVACLLASPLARGLFHKAIVQSGGADHVHTRAEAARVAQVFCLNLGLTTENAVQRLEQATLEELVRAQRDCWRMATQRADYIEPMPQFGMTAMPVIGDDVLPDVPVRMIARGQGADVPLLAGTTLHEWNLFVFSPQMGGKASTIDRFRSLDDAGLLHMVLRSLPREATAQEAVAQYQQLLPGLSRADIFCAIETDRMFRLPVIRLCEAQAQAGRPVYQYLFDWRCPYNASLGACHVMEVPFVFGSVDSPAGQIFTGGGERARQLAQTVMQAWATFARGGDPGVVTGTAWPAYEAQQRQVMLLSAEPAVVQNPEAGRRQFWEKIFC